MFLVHTLEKKIEIDRVTCQQATATTIPIVPLAPRAGAAQGPLTLTLASSNNPPSSLPLTASSGSAVTTDTPPDPSTTITAPVTIHEGASSTLDGAVPTTTDPNNQTSGPSEQTFNQADAMEVDGITNAGMIGDEDDEVLCLLADLFDDEGVADNDTGTGLSRGRLSKAATAEIEAFGQEVRRKALALGEKYGKSSAVIMLNAGLGIRAARARNRYNDYYSWWSAKNHDDLVGGMCSISLFTRFSY